MPLEPTRFYRTHLAGLHRQLLSSPLTRTYLTGTGIRLDGAVLNPDDVYELPIGVLSLVEFAHLFSVFDGSRVHQQAKHTFGPDEAPPGLYFTVVNPRLIQHPGKNRLGLFTDPDGGTDLFIDGLHIDQYFLDERNTPPTLGIISFTLRAIMAHLGGLSHVSLLAAGGHGFNQRYIGYKVWPKLGFDAPLRPDEVEQAQYLARCQSVQDVLAIDPQWWEDHGIQRTWAGFFCRRKIAPTVSRQVFQQIFDCSQHIFMLPVEDAGNLKAGGNDLAVFDLNGRMCAVCQRGNVDGFHGERSSYETDKALPKRYHALSAGGQGVDNLYEPGGLLSLAGVVSVTPPAMSP